MKDRSGIKLLNEYYLSSIDNKKSIVDSIFQKIENIGKSISLTSEELYLAIDETISNAMEHGNKWDPDKRIHVEVTSDNLNFNIRVTDEGEGFNTDNIQDKLKNRNILSTRGRGIYIIQKLCKPTWNEKGNQINLKIKWLSQKSS